MGKALKIKKNTSLKMGQIYHLVPQKIQDVIDDYLRTKDQNGYRIIRQSEANRLTCIVNDELQRLHLIPPGAKGVANNVTRDYLRTLGISILRI